MAAGYRTSRGLIPLGSYTETNPSQVFTDITARGVRLYLNITDAGTGSGGLSVVVYGVDKISGNACAMTDGGVPVNSVGLWVYEMTPFANGQLVGGIVDSVARTLPFQWFAQVQAADNSPYTYSLSVEITD